MARTSIFIGRHNGTSIVIRHFCIITFRTIRTALRRTRRNTQIQTVHHLVNATLFPASGSENVNPDTHLVLTFSETPVLGDSGMIRVYDAVTDQVVDSLDLSIPSGPTESRTYGPECDYTKVPLTILVPLCLPIKILVRVLLRERRNLLFLCTTWSVTAS